MILTVAQQKGGVGKTTTAVNLAVQLAKRGERVLAVDTDPQFALTRQLGIATATLSATLLDVLGAGVDPSDAILSDQFGCDVLPADRRLSGLELSLVGEMGRETFLATALEALESRYDTIIIDTPPNLGLLTVNALMPADVVIAPVSAEDEGSAQGLAELTATIKKLERLRNGTQPDVRVLVTKWQSNRVMTDVVEEAVTRLGHQIVARVPRRTTVQQAAAQRTPISVTAPDSAPASAYSELLDTLNLEVLS